MSRSKIDKAEAEFLASEQGKGGFSDEAVGPNVDLWYVDTRSEEKVAQRGPIQQISVSHVLVDLRKGNKISVSLRDALYLLARMPDNFTDTAPSQPTPSPAPAPTPVPTPIPAPAQE